MSDNRTIPLTSELLNLIMMVQDYKRFKLSESMFKSSHSIEKTDYRKEIEEFYNAIGDEVLNKYDLSTNKLSFERVINFKVTDVMLRTPSEKLARYFKFYEPIQYRRD